ncbi:hypothetical protein KJ763_00855, partial [Patescibacteria group bacterium]|nr:hypothetical protein [Patescibacteria group bacterium]
MTKEEIQLSGKILVSLKKASEISGYAKDYIGQLCRANKINSKRIGRDWFVSIDDLISYQKKAIKIKKINSLKLINKTRDDSKEIPSSQIIKDLSPGLAGLILILFLIFFSSNIKSVYADWLEPGVKETAIFVSDNLKIAFNNLENGAEVAVNFLEYLELKTEQGVMLSISYADKIVLPEIPEIKINLPKTFVKHSVFDINIKPDFSFVKHSVFDITDSIFETISSNASEIYQSAIFSSNVLAQDLRNILGGIGKIPGKSIAYINNRITLPELVKHSVFDINIKPNLSFMATNMANTITGVSNTAVSFFSFFNNGMEAVGNFTKDVADAWIMAPQNISELAQELFGQKTSIVAVQTPSASPTSDIADVAKPASDVVVIQNPVVKTVVEKTIEKIISGLTSEELNTKLNQLNSQILNQISGLKNELASQINANQHSIALTNRINNLGSVTISNPTFSGTVAGLTDAMIPDDITASNYLTLSGGVITGALDVGGNTDITGDLTVGGNTIVINGQINVGDKVITQGDIGVGTSTPMAKLAVQATDIATTSMVIWGIDAQTLPHLQIFSNSGIEQFTFTADGNLGVGTSSPFSKLSVGGSGWFDDYVTSSYFTATSTTATSTFPYLTSAGLQISSWLDFPANSITDAMIPDTITADNYFSLTNWYATTTHALISSLPSLSITESQISDLTHFTNNDWDIRMTGTTTLPSITTLANLASVGTLTSGAIGAGFTAI